MNSEIEMTLDEAVQEVMGLLYGLDLDLVPEFDRYYAITRQLNAALRANAREVEWSYYSSVENVGRVRTGDRELSLRSSLRPRIITDDAVRLVDRKGDPRVWAYFMARDSLHKYRDRAGLWVAVVRSSLAFSRPIRRSESGLEVHVPVMREPEMFRLPSRPRTTAEDIIEVPEDIRQQPVDFDAPDAIVTKAAMLIAQSDPILQPRVQTLEDQYKDIMYNLKERDERYSDSPFQNDFFVVHSNTEAHLTSGKSDSEQHLRWLRPSWPLPPARR